MAQARLGVGIEPPANPHLPPHLRIPTIRLKYSWYRRQQEAGPKTTSGVPELSFTVPLTDENRFDRLSFWMSGNRVRIEWEDENLSGFFAPIVVDPKVWAQAEDGEIDRLPVRILLTNQADRSRAGADTEHHFYRRGFLGKPAPKRDKSDPEDARSHQRGKSDAVNFYRFGTSQPGLEVPDWANLFNANDGRAYLRHLETAIPSILPAALDRATLNGKPLPEMLKQFVVPQGWLARSLAGDFVSHIAADWYAQSIPPGHDAMIDRLVRWLSTIDWTDYLNVRQQNTLARADVYL